MKAFYQDYSVYSSTAIKIISVKDVEIIYASHS